MPPREQVQLSPLLIAEDDPATRELVRELFADAGYTIIETSDGQEALVLLRQSAEPYVVLLDDRMPSSSCLVSLTSHVNCACSRRTDRGRGQRASGPARGGARRRRAAVRR
jgi:CheY-like chemotaxis protein